MGVEKGKTPVTKEIINEISNKIKTIKKGLSFKAEQGNNAGSDKKSGCSCGSC
jgi:hypothetical protein